VKMIGLVGPGLLGTAMADRLLSRGWSVSGFDVDSDRRAALSQAGGVALNRLEDVAGFDVILPMSAVYEKLIEELVQAGNGDLDNSAIIKAFRSAE